jgi:hypothetical protein
VCEVAQLFASCFLPSSSHLILILLFTSFKMNSAFKLPTFSDAFPDGLPEYSGSSPLPSWDSMEFNIFVKSLGPFCLGLFEIPIANVNTHDLQRDIDEEYMEKDLLTSIATSKDAYVHPGTAILNTNVIPRDSEGNPDPNQMKVTIPDGGHRSTAVGRMEWPEEKKTWVYMVYEFRMYQLCLISKLSSHCCSSSKLFFTPLCTC